MKAPPATVLLWLWLVYSGLLTWCSPGSYLIVTTAAELDDPSSAPPVTASPLVQETTDNPNYDYNIESIDADTTTAKSGRNFGGRIRGINSLPYGNSVNSNNNNGTGGGFLRPRPSPSVISFNPTNYNRVLKRRKNGTVTTTIDGVPVRTRTTATPLKSNAFFNNYYTVNRTRAVPEDGQGGGGEAETVVPSSQGNINNNNHNRSTSQKFTVRKRPRPVTISDIVETTTAIPTTMEPEDSTVQPETNSVISDGVVPRSSNPQNVTSPSSVNATAELPVVPASTNRTQSNALRVEKEGPVVLPMSPASANAPPDNHNNGSKSLQAEPVSHVPVFEYNPSVTVKDGVYRFHYSEPTYSSKKVHKENFGITHETYDDGEDDEDSGVPLETTTYAPDDDRHTTIPYHINIDGSEEEFTSSLPPAYRDYIGNQEAPHKRVPHGEHPRPEEQPQGVVTVTVTHTVVAGSSSISHHDNNSSNNNAKSNEVAAAVASEETNSFQKEAASPAEDEEVNANNRIHATPVLPSLPRTRNQSEIVQIHSSSVADTTVEVTHHEHDGHVDTIKTLNESSVSPATSGPVTSKVVSSVFYTKHELPGYTTSSYSFTESTVYSYGHPDDHYHDEDEHDEGHPHGEHSGNSVEKQQQELRPTTTSFWDALGKQSAELLKSKTVTSLNDSSSSSSSDDQDSGFSTPEAETEIPPVKFHTTTPIPTAHVEDHSEDNEIDDGGKAINKTQQADGTVLHVVPPPQGPGIIYDERDAEIPSVPVYIQVLIDMSAKVFCSRISLFKHMVASVYPPALGVLAEQVIVVNELNCSNITSQHNHQHHHPHHQHENSTSGNGTDLLNESNIKYATTTATVLRTISSSTARTVIPPNRASPSGGRVKRHDDSSHHQSSVHHPGDDGRNLTADQVNDTEISRSSSPAVRGPSITTALYPVFFYLNDKNGTYDRSLTESFIHYWNTSKAANTMFYDKIKKVDMITPTQGIIGEASSNENTGIIAAITIASIAAVCLFLLGILLLVMRHRQAKSKFAKRCTPVSLDDYSLDNISVYNSFRRKQRNRASKRSYTNAGFDDPNAPSRPCNAAVLTAIIAEPGKIEEEFRNLPTMTPTLDDIPAGAETKNRYANVIPIPDTRVLLTFQEDVPNSDYINANFVRGPMGTPKGYIITQGPLDETIVDFWRMVWEQQIRVIMMLTDFAEAGIAKCAEYYPRSETVDSSQLHGDFQITLEKRDITDNCITSYLVIKDMERNLRRDVIHLWYHSWPEKGVPNNPKSTIDFLLKSRKFTKEPTPVLVHCSPGTGRSGTLVACDICMREWDTQHSINIPRTVMKIRQDRAGAVQTKEQYMHIYQVLQSYSSRLTVSSVDPA